MHAKCGGRGQRHPQGDVRVRTVALSNDQVAVLTKSAMPDDGDDRPDPRVIGVANLRLARRLFVGNMCLLRLAWARAIWCVRWAMH